MKLVPNEPTPPLPGDAYDELEEVDTGGADPSDILEILLAEHPEMTVPEAMDQAAEIVKAMTEQEF